MQNIQEAFRKNFLTKKSAFRRQIEGRRRLLRAKTPEMMTVSDLRAYLRTNYYAAKALLTSGTLPGNQVNERGDWRVMKEDVDAWLKSKRKGQVEETK